MADNEKTAEAGSRTVVVDLVVAFLIFILGALVTYDSYKLGSSWGVDGPEAGYFPFFIGLMICISTVVVMVQCALKLKTDRTVFATHSQLKQVLIILVPSFLYVSGIQLVGLYVPSALFIALFMKFVGKYSWLRSVIVGCSVSVVAFVLFELWFKIPLPKGPVESMFGY